jgi:hypothetical protein
MTRPGNPIVARRAFGRALSLIYSPISRFLEWMRRIEAVGRKQRELEEEFERAPEKQNIRTLVALQTTPEDREFQRLLREMRAAGMEVPADFDKESERS